MSDSEELRHPQYALYIYAFRKETNMPKEAEVGPLLLPVRAFAALQTATLA
jgi:hypothetical protein